MLAAQTFTDVPYKALKKGKGFFLNEEPDCNRLRYYTRCLNFQKPQPPRVI